MDKLEIGSKSIEIERKYSCSKEQWNSFIDLCRSKNPSNEVVVEGPDTYFKKDDLVVRWRYSEDLSELTIKSRYSKSSTIVREESEIVISEDNQPKMVLLFLKRLGFKKLFRIKKYCHIFWFNTPDGEICAVIYRVVSKNRRDRYFIELEAEKGLSVSVSKNMIRKWEKELNLPVHRRVNESLYEIYSGEITKMVDRASQEILCIKCNNFKNSQDFYPSWLKKSGSKCKDCCIKENLSENALKQVSLRNKERRKTDINYKLKVQIRNRINHALKNKGKRKISAVTSLGCSVDDLKKFLEKKFYINPVSGKPMTWADWGLGPGKWQIDHVKPLKNFNLDDRFQFLEACHYTNLQPLWFEDHVIKTNEENKELKLGI